MQSYEFEGVNYVFRLSRGAKVEIEDLQASQLDGLSEMDSESLSSFFDLTKLDEKNNDKEMTDEQKGKLMLKMIPLLKQMNKLNSGLDNYEIGFILLKNNADYRGKMDRDLFNKIVDDMEEKLSFEETYKFFEEIKDKVFTILENIQKREEQKQTYQNGIKSLVS